MEADEVGPGFARKSGRPGLIWARTQETVGDNGLVPQLSFGIGFAFCSSNLLSIISWLEHFFPENCSKETVLLAFLELIEWG